MDDRIEQLARQLDLPAKLRLISGAGMFRMAGDPAIGLAEMPVSDGPSGVRGENWDERDPSVSLPSGTALAATWDRDLLTEIGALIAAEAHRKNVHAVLGPTVNLHRSPLGGRHFECFSEDPMLTAEIAAAYVRAVQAHGVAACPKHYVANDSETDRFTVDVRVAARALHELYLYPFERAVAAGTWMVMAAYNSVAGATMTESPLLDEPLKGSWGFDGVVVSDWTAVRSTDGAAHGTDLCMPGPSPLWGQALADAIAAGTVPESAIDDKVRRILRLADRVGGFASAPGESAPRPVISGAEARALVRRAAAAAMVLVHNDGVLPLAPHTSIAVLGPAAADPRYMGGGSATVLPDHTVTPVEGLSAVLPVTHTPGVRLGDDPVPVPLELVTDPVTGTPGLCLRYLDGDRVLDTQHRTAGRLVLFGDPHAAAASAIELRARLRADVGGAWRIGVAALGHCVLELDGEAVIDTEIAFEGSDPVAALLDPPQRFVERELSAGQTVEVRITVGSGAEAAAGLGMILGVGLGIGRPQRAPEDEFAAAIEAARSAEVAVVVVGTTEQLESEGRDRTTLALPGRQNDLVAAVAAANPRTVVVVNSGAPVEMPWRDEVAAVLLTWFPGQEFGAALADVVTGAAEPGGRLPTTWPKELADVPVRETIPDADGRLTYDEGIHIGYRAWLRAGVQPAFPFGHGLGYTVWELSDLLVDGHDVEVTVANIGERDGKQIVQVYLSREDSEVERPVRWLAAFAAVTVAAGDRQRVRITVPRRSFQHWDEGGWSTESGPFTVHVGTSVIALPLTAPIE
ncbi:glycoside hydrolase family 3 C-terminal domain-containing protein [Nocardia sp. NPDC052254]|uniref:beta-glucosidase n=1 Tax=Nocardia sp. NPDC052254 TaxID=3155681 RepID=UPI003429B261